MCGISRHEDSLDNHNISLYNQKSQKISVGKKEATLLNLNNIWIINQDIPL